MKALPFLPVFFLTIASTTPNLHAAIRVKADNSDALNLASSWTNGFVPGSADVAQFDSTISGPITVALGADTVWNQLAFGNAGGDVTIAAGNRLTLSNNTPIASSIGTANLTLNCDVVFAGPTFSLVSAPGSGRTLTFGGVIQGRAATVTLGAGGTILLNNPLTTLIGSPVQINAGRLGIGASSIGDPITSGPLGTNQFVWTGSAQLFAFNGSQTLANPLRIPATAATFNSADELTFTSVIDLNNGNRSINVSNGVLRFTGTLSNATGLTKIGSGTLELGGTNVAVFGNGLSIFGGTVRLLTNDVIPHTPTAGTLRMTNVAQVLDMNGFSETIRGAAGSGGSGNWNGTIDNTAPGTTSTLTLGDQFTYTLAGNLQNSGLNAKLALAKIGTGGLILTNAKTFSGGITNASASELFVNSAGAAGTGPIVLAVQDAELVFSAGGFLALSNNIVLEAPAVISASDFSTLELAGVISGPGTLLRTNTFFQQGPLIFSGDNTFTGGFALFGGTVMFSHPRAAGTGLLSIGNPTFTGGTINILPGIDLSGANALTNAVLVNRDFTIGGTSPLEFAGPVVLITNAVQRSINVTNLAGAIISGPVSGYGFNKVGPGLLTLNGLCTHDGPSTISVGPLAIGPAGQLAGATTILIGGGTLLDVTAKSDFTVLPNQILTGNGRVRGNVAVDGQLFTPTIGATVTFSNNLTLNPGSTTTIHINRNSPLIEKLTCFGTLLYGGTLVVSNLGAAPQLGDTFDLIEVSGSPGNFNNLNLPALNAGLAWNTSNLGIDGTISVVSSAPAQPEISSPALLNPSNFVMTVTGGTSNGQFRVLSQTNVATPLVNWEPLSTNLFDGAGNLTITNPVNPADPQRFFRIVQP